MDKNGEWTLTVWRGGVGEFAHDRGEHCFEVDGNVFNLQLKRDRLDPTKHTLSLREINIENITKMQETSPKLSETHNNGLVWCLGLFLSCFS